MQEISKKPLVDILSQMSGRQVVMSGNDYVFLTNSITLSKSEVDEALALQEKLYTKDLNIKNKQGTEELIQKMTIKTKSGKTFHADYQARINMMSGVMSAEFANKNETIWKLYDKDENGENIETMVTLDELKEATYLALEKFGTLKSIGV